MGTEQEDQGGQRVHPRVSLVSGIMILAVLSRFDSVISPSVASIQASFPQDDPSAVESVVSIGSSAAIVSALIFGQLMTWMRFKTAGILACLCLASGGLLPLVFHESIFQLLFFAMVVGFGVGIITTILPSLSARFYRGRDLSALMGQVLAVQDGSSMVILALGGILARRGWLYNYGIYLLTIPALVLVVLLVPGIGAAGGVAPNRQHHGDPETSSKHQSWWAIITCIGIGFLSIFLVAVLYNKLAVLIDHRRLGDTGSAGLALMFSTGSSVLIGFSINIIRQVCRGWTIPGAFLLMALGGLILSGTHSLALVCLGSFLVGSGSAINMATCPFLLSNLTLPKRYPLIMGIFSATTSLGFTTSTWFFKGFAAMLGVDPTTGSFLGMMIFSLLVAFLLVVSRFQKRVEGCFISSGEMGGK